MRRDFVYGAIFGFCILGLMGLTQISTTFKDETALFNEFSNLYQGVQPRIWRLANSTPTVSTISNQEVILYQSTQSAVAPRLYTKISGNLWFVNLSSK